jgi:hypothetical protein
VVVLIDEMHRPALLGVIAPLFEVSEGCGGIPGTVGGVVTASGAGNEH